ncbi:helix-turn-helix transcriptional regulator [Lactococcus garvieae]|uniref:helix-turn-helix transcriptional regulator n=1 Tax=Lactococcus garvieae TaxID=1363 RepID=UPI0022DF7901|nr:AraC family transcriptional regulator [Lactococcus garvieae]
MIHKIYNFLESIGIEQFAILDQKFNVLFQSDSISKRTQELLTNLSSQSYFFSHVEKPDGSHLAFINTPQKLLIVLSFPTYQLYLDNIEKIFSKMIYEIFNMATIPQLAQKSFHNLNFESKIYYDQKRQLELFFAHAVRSCNYSQVDALIPKLYSYSFQKDSKSELQFIQRCVISLIAILTRIVINENVDPYLAYSLSDKHLRADYSLLEKDYHVIIKQIVYDFILLLENHNYKFNCPVIDEAIIYIRRNLYSELFVSDVAFELGISTQYLSKIFKKVTGKNIKYFIQSEKIKESKFLLINTDLSIYEISFELGYSSQSLFAKNFKEFYNMTPSLFRKIKVF